MSLRTTEHRTIDFHLAFGHPVRSNPQTLSRDEAMLALKLIEEEFMELVTALFPSTEGVFDYIVDVLDLFDYDPQLVDVADALGDLDVVVNGAGIRHGFDMQAIGREVFESNMSKLGEDGKPIYREDGKILKGPGFREPNLARALAPLN